MRGGSHKPNADRREKQMPEVKVTLSDEQIEKLLSRYRTNVADAILKTVEDVLKEKNKEDEELLAKIVKEVNKAVEKINPDIGVVKEFGDRLNELHDKITSLQKTVASVKGYTTRIKDSLIAEMDVIHRELEKLHKNKKEKIENIEKEVNEIKESLMLLRDRINVIEKTVDGLLEELGKTEQRLKNNPDGKAVVAMLNIAIDILKRTIEATNG